MAAIQGPHFQRSGRIARLRARRTDANEGLIVNASGLNEVYDQMAESSEAIKYAIGAMQPIEPAYTLNTYNEGNRVKNQLESNFGRYGIACEFEYQGSVTNDTHIKAKSDIDLLTVHSAFFSLDHPQQPSNPYHGDPVQDLLQLRAASGAILINKFPEAKVDLTGSKSITINGGSLRRKIDVVASNWCDTNEYSRTGIKRDRGIHILDAYKKERLRNLPFLHNDRLHNKDQRTIGGYRKAVRLLKSLKYDSDDGVDLSSYDIAAVVYAMSDQDLAVTKGTELILVDKCKVHLDFLAANQPYRESLDVPNGTRKVFCAGGATLAALNQLRREVDQLRYDIENDLSRSFRRLLEARVQY